jgi:hypothetical protein
VTVKIKQKSLPPNVSVYGDSDNYCNALEFYVNGQYCGYIQCGIAPVGLGLRERYGRNNVDRGIGVSTQHSLLTVLYYGRNMGQLPVDISSAVIATGVTNPSVSYDSTGNYVSYDVYDINGSYYVLIDMDIPEHNILTVQSQIGRVNKATMGYPSLSSSVEHTTNTLTFGNIVMYQTLSNSTSPYGHAGSCSYYPSTSSNTWSRMLSNYLADCNCLNETNGISDNIYNQQYYYLGDGLTKQQAQELLGCCAFRTRNVEFITE